MREVVEKLSADCGHYREMVTSREKAMKVRTWCKTNFLQFYQVISAIPKHLVTKAKNTVTLESEPYIENGPFFQLDDLTAIHLDKAKTRDFYCLFNKKIHTRCQTGPTKWNQQCTWMEWRGKEYLTP